MFTQIFTYFSWLFIIFTNLFSLSNSMKTPPDHGAAPRIEEVQTAGRSGAILQWAPWAEWLVPGKSKKCEGTILDNPSFIDVVKTMP